MAFSLLMSWWPSAAREPSVGPGLALTGAHPTQALTEEHPEHGRKRFAGRRAVHRNSIAVPYLGRVHRLAMQPPPRAAGAGAAAKTRLASVCTAQFRGSHLRSAHAVCVESTMALSPHGLRWPAQ